MPTLAAIISRARARRDSVQMTSSTRLRPPRPFDRPLVRRHLPGGLNVEIACAAQARLWPCPASPQRARMARAASGWLRVSYPMASTRWSRSGTRTPSPGISHCKPPRLRPIPLLAFPVRRRALLASCSSVNNHLGLCEHVLFQVVLKVCVSPAISFAFARPVARRARSLFAAPLLGRSVAGIGADSCVALVPPLTSSGAQVVYYAHLATMQPASSRPARRRPRAERCERRRSHACPRSRACMRCDRRGSVCSLWVAPAGGSGRV